jgi:hypothetical protein
MSGLVQSPQIPGRQRKQSRLAAARHRSGAALHVGAPRERLVKHCPAVESLSGLSYYLCCAGRQGDQNRVSAVWDCPGAAFHLGASAPEELRIHQVLALLSLHIR